MARTVAKLAQQLNHRHAKGKKYPPLLLMCDEDRLPNPLLAIQKLPKGSAVIIRSRTVSGKILLIQQVKATCRRKKLRILVSECPKIALRYQLDGVHYPESKLKRAEKKRRRSNWLVTTACHNQRALMRAQKWGVDAVTLSPVFSTSSHPGASWLGPARFAQLTRHPKPSVYALGGINNKNARRLSCKPIIGFAGVSGLT